MELAKAGHSPAIIASLLPYNRTFIAKWVKRANDEVAADRPRIGRPNLHSRPTHKQLKSILSKRATSSLRRAAKHYSKLRGVEVSKDTIASWVNHYGLTWRLRPRKPKLSEKQRTARFDYALLPRRWGWEKRMLWTDEHYLSLRMFKRGQWCQEGEEPDAIERSKYGDGSVKIWAGISWHGRTKLYPISKKATASDYQTLLKAGPLQEAHTMHAHLKNGWSFMEDGAGFHKAKNMAFFWAGEGVQLHQSHPANSPDLNPFENAWHLLNMELRNYDFDNKAQLLKVAQRVWQNIPFEKFRQNIGSMPNRLKAVMAANGGHTKY